MSFIFNPFTGNLDDITDVSVTAVGASPNANSATVIQIGTSAALTLQPADGSNPGVVTANTQTIGGAKTLTAALSLSSNQIHNVTDPTAAQDAATKAYVDAAVAALQPATAVYAATTTNIPGTYLNGVVGVGATFTTTATGTFTLDGVTPVLGSRLLIKDQSSGFQNGIYNITTLGTVGISTVLTRSLDYNTASDMNSAGLIPVINGTSNALSSWQQTAVITTVGTDSLVFQEFTANPSLYLLKANNLNDVASKSTSFNNISPVTTTGDLIYSASAATNTRLAVGSTGNVLTVAGGVPTWAPPATAGTVTAVSVVSTNGFAGTSSGGATPALTLTTTVTGILQGNGTAISAATTTGSGAVVLATSPTLVTPALGTPSALVGTNITGTAASLTAGTVTTNANLTGDVTSVGNATTLATVNSNVGSFSNANITVNAKGLITAASSGAAGSVSVVSKTSAYSATSSDGLILCSGSAFTVTLPTAVGISGTIIRIKKTDSSLTNIITVATTSSQTIDGSTTFKLSTQYEEVEVASDGSNWQVLDHTYPQVWVQYTPTFVGFGTVTAMNIWSRRVGDTLEVRGSSTIGTPTAVLGTMTIGFNGTSANVTTDATKTSTLAGMMASSTSGTISFYVLASANTTFVNFSQQDAGHGALTPENGNILLQANSGLDFFFSVPIAGWQG